LSDGVWKAITSNEMMMTSKIKQVGNIFLKLPDIAVFLRDRRARKYTNIRKNTIKIHHQKQLW
jgi:hypothetical protein